MPNIGLECIVVEPTEEHTATVIWLHGLGASGNDFEPIVPVLDMPHARFVFPHAPIMPVTINNGMKMPAWYDILIWDGNSDDREDVASLRASAQLIEDLIESEHERGIPYERIVLAGFSQGAAMTLHVGVRFEHKLAGLMALSGYEVLSDKYSDEHCQANSQTPMLFCHGVFDQVIPVEMGRKSLEDMVERGHTCEWNGYRMGHEVIMEQLQRISEWLQDLLP